MYYDKRNKKLYETRTKLAEAHPALNALKTATEAHAYFFEQDIEVLTVVTPPDVNYDIYTLVPGPVNIENNTLTMVSQLRQDLSMESIFKQRWDAAKAALDVLYRQVVYEVPAVELISWSNQEKEANLRTGRYALAAGTPREHTGLMIPAGQYVYAYSSKADTTVTVFGVEGRPTRFKRDPI